MKTDSTKKLANMIAIVTAQPIQTAEHKNYREAQMYVELKDGRTLKVYSFNKVALAAIGTITERARLVIFGNFIASDAFRMTSFKAI